ncbi:uncharacterized protein LOC110704077 [Chenopodium quinoa]|uniref:uncharacterized protein LOC110704077 n=1 Tax=Chenopodium quinoa TaxID=63459 RepID=UPI000B7805B7|nr:uncharacterized protein LOC110704077 [Chenopodium quinoa]
MAETPPSIREISEPSTNRSAGPDYLHSSSRITNEGNSNYDSAENPDTTMHDISAAKSDECMVHEKTSNNSRVSKRQRTIAAMSQSPVSIREIGETSAQALKSSSPVVPGPCYDTPVILQTGKKGKTQTKSENLRLHSRLTFNCRETEPPSAAVGLKLPTTPLKLKPPRFCAHCNAKKFQHETLHFCCRNGAITLATNEYPLALYRLLTSNDEDALHFRRYIRLYNNLFAFCSFGGDYKAKKHKGIYVFKLHGQIYHYLPDLIPKDIGPRYLQLYFYDGHFESTARTESFPEIRADLIAILMEVTQQNPYAQFFRSLKEIDIHEETQIIINKNTVLDQRVYNAPTTDEVAAIWPDDTSSSELNGPYITSQGLKKNDGQVHQQSQTDPVLSTAVHTEEDVIAQEACRLADAGGTSARHVSPREYYAYKLQCRPNNMLLRAGRCLQQYIVDMYVKIENTRLDYFRHNQQKIRDDLYQRVLDSIQDGETSAINIGRRVILPPTFIGGPRDMKRRYLNAMALVQRFGKPDLFVTMTCNANWPEIKAELAPGELAQNRPDLVARIFRAKLICLKKQIMKKHIFGKVATMIYVIEFQKRGLPHAHFLIILKPNYKMKTPSDFDHFVSAELPPHTSPQLRKIVVKHMMHDPCGEQNLKCPCMVTKNNNILSCKYGYPKGFLAETTNHDDGYPMYRRRDSGERVRIRGAYLDNRSVIPYNPYLSALFDCHLNVEICSSIQAHLPVHLENMQTVHLRNNEQLNSDVLNERRSKTQLTEFFKANAASVEGTGYLYSQFIEHNRWDSSAKAWFRRRNKNKVIGRLATVTPAEGERFFLRLLLINVLNPKSFIDLRTVNGMVCATFQEACIQRGLFEEDNGVFSCLFEAAEIHMPSALRRLFAAVLVFCRPRNPDALWLQFYNDLSDDYRHTLPRSERQVKLLTIQSIQRHLESMGKSLAKSKCSSANCLRKNNFSCKIVLPTATSGIAAANIPSGRTTHSRFKIPLDSEISLVCDVPKQGSLAALLKETTLFILDEASMALKQNIESVDLLLRDLCDPAFPFGGKVIVFGGDFRQVLPVVPQKTQREAVATSLVNSRIWPWLEKMHLTENIRAKEDPTYASFLLSLGNDFSPDIFRERAILTPLNDAVDSINAFLIDKFPGETAIYRSFDSILDNNCAIYPTEFLNQLAPSGMSPHELVLKVNSPVILLRNIDPADGLRNGTRLICKYFRRNVIVCSIALGHRQGELVFIHRVNLRPPSSTKFPIQFERIQFPLKLSFAMTINKAQGQTLSQVPSQKSNKVTVITPQPTGKYTGTVLKNIVAYDVLKLSVLIHCWFYQYSPAFSFEQVSTLLPYIIVCILIAGFNLYSQAAI